MVTRLIDVFKKLLEINLMGRNSKFMHFKMDIIGNSSFRVMFELLENPKESELTNNNIDQELKFQRLTFHSRSRKFTRGLCKYSLNSRIVREMSCGGNKTFSMNEMEMLANKSVFINKTGQLYSFKEYLVLKNEKRLTVCKDYWPRNCSHILK